MLCQAAVPVGDSCPCGPLLCVPVSGRLFTGADFHCTACDRQRGGAAWAGQPLCGGGQGNGQSEKQRTLLLGSCAQQLWYLTLSTRWLSIASAELRTGARNGLQQCS